MAATVLLALPRSAEAQFELTQVSGPGSAPFLLTKAGGRFEDLSGTHPEITYSVYRKLPGDGFRCLVSGLASPAWAGDPATPLASVHWYSVVADDTWGENQHGNAIPRVEYCPCGGPGALPGQPSLVLHRIPGNVVDPVHVTSAPGDRSRLFVVEKAGRIRLYKRGVLQAAPFLDIRSRVVSAIEQGLLSVAFHPQYASNGRFFVFYTAPGGGPRGHIVVAEIVTSDPDSAGVDPVERVLLSVDRSNEYHNGGQLMFGPADGFLYISIGDDGLQDDAQRLGVLRGKLLRIDVDSGQPYAIPPDNPFVGVAGALPEIWAYGLRNPWRFGFDRLTDDLYLGDVGTDCREEINFAGAPRAGGENYGWRFLEGSFCVASRCASSCGPSCPSAPDCAPYTMPVHEYVYGAPAGGVSVIGGFAYRGCRLPGYAGTYFYGDWVPGWVRSFVIAGGLATDHRDWGTFGGTLRQPVSFGEDAQGEIYLVMFGSNGSLWRIGAP